MIQVAAPGGNNTAQHACARKTDGTLWCWGRNDRGQLGNGSTITSATPVQVAALGNSVAQVATGEVHVCAMKSDGTLWCWGGNNSGQLGKGTTRDSASPVQVTNADGSPLVAMWVSARQSNTCARKVDGTAFCWGLNSSSQLGDGTFENRLRPTLVATIRCDCGDGICSPWESSDSCPIDCGASRCGDGKCTSDESCWNGNSGCLADCGSCAGGGAPLSLGDYHTCSTSRGQHLVVLGPNDLGELGNGSTGLRMSPVQVAAMGTSAVQVVGGGAHTCARKSDGTLWCWGYNGDGELGNGSTTSSLSPIQVTALGASVAQVAAASVHTCARKTDGTLWCWGYNGDRRARQWLNHEEHESGPGHRTGNLGGAGRAGGLHTCALKTDGTLWCWGSNLNYELGDGSQTNRLIPVQVSALGSSVDQVAGRDHHACARKTDGTLWCWGSAYLGDGKPWTATGTPVQVTALGSSVVQIAVGGTHTCARRMDGTLWCWGYNTTSQLGNGLKSDSPSPVQVTALGSSVAQVGAGYQHTCARKTDGSLWCWGYDSHYELGKLDSAPSLVPRCGDGICQFGEQQYGSCPADCGYPLASLSLAPASVVGGIGSTGTVSLSGPAPRGGAVVALSTSNSGVAAPTANVIIAAGQQSASFPVSTSTVATWSSVAVSAAYAGATQTATLTVTNGQCAPSCTGKSCGDNGCGGSCGTCAGTLTCNGSGQCVDTTAPAVSITAPTGGTVSGSITVSASASDNVGVVGVQFMLDGANLGSEVMASPYNYTWNTTTATNGSHTLTAVARDAAGNKTTSSGVAVTVSNTTTLVGVTSIGGTAETTAAQKAVAYKYTAAASGTLKKLNVYVNGGGTSASTVQVGIYSNSSSKPGTLLASCSISVAANAAAGWFNCSPAATALTSGTVYWIAILNGASSGTVKYKDTTGSGTNSYPSKSTMSTLPSSFGTTGTASSNTSASFYGTN